MFTAVSHEFRTPLFAILAHAELMADPARRPANDRWPTEYGATITDAAQMLMQRVDELLDLARSEAGELVLKMSTVDMSAIARSAVEKMRGLAERRAQVSLLLHVEGLEHHLSADRVRLEQVLLNLLSNV